MSRNPFWKPDRRTVRALKRGDHAEAHPRPFAPRPCKYCNEYITFKFRRGRFFPMSPDGKHRHYCQPKEARLRN